MHTRTRLLRSALVAALVLLAAACTASANRFSFTDQHFSAIWDPTVAGSEAILFEEGSGFPLLACDMTLQGSFHSATFAKVANQLIGYITTAESAGCESEFILLNGHELLPNGRSAPNTLPWHIRYESFRGILPAIEEFRVQFVGLALLIHIPSLSVGCLYLSKVERPWRGFFSTVGGGVGFLNAPANDRIPLKTQLEGLCVAEPILRGGGVVTVQGGTREITVHLI